jgi:hypothetical protein
MNIPFQTIDWSAIEKVEHKGDTGTSFWRTMQFDGLRIRIVEYSANYLADHWCQKGHIVHCLDGEFVSENENAESVTMRKGMTYVVSDDMSSHRSTSRNGATLLIVDGDFLKLRQQATGNRQQAAGNRQQAAGSRQQATGSRQQATGNSGGGGTKRR